MFIQPRDATPDESEGQPWIAEGHGFGRLSVNGLPGRPAVVAPTHFTTDKRRPADPPRPPPPGPEGDRAEPGRHLHRHQRLRLRPRPPACQADVRAKFTYDDHRPVGQRADVADRLAERGHSLDVATARRQRRLPDRIRIWKPCPLAHPYTPRNGAPPMTVFRIDPAVADAFPDTLIAVVTATGLRGHGPWPATTATLQDLEQQLADGTWQPADETDPRIEAWHTAYRSFGTNPRRIRPSVDALGRRFTKKGTLPRVNPAVDSYNAVSVQHGLPAGAFDLDHVTGRIAIQYADGTEEFTPLGEPGTTENPKPGEIVYADTTGVLTRHWNHRDAHRTRVTEDSTHVAFVFETLHVSRDGHLLKAAALDLQGLLAPHTGQTAVYYLSPDQPQVTV